MNEDMIPLTVNDTFPFSCSNEVPCFNECCRDLNQFLTPYDILRIKNHLKLTSSEFLEKYTLQHIGPETGLPVVTFKTDPSSKLKCPFVLPEGCSIYEDRPASCRTYPLARLATRSPETNNIIEYFMLIKEPHCLGHEQQKTITVREWIKNQGIEPYNKMNDLLMEIIGLKKRLKPGEFNLSERHIFQMACYDLDSFRTHVFEKNILERFPTDSNGLDKAKTDDEELLKLGLKWIKNAIFKE